MIQKLYVPWSRPLSHYDSAGPKFEKIGTSATLGVCFSLGDTLFLVQANRAAVALDTGRDRYQVKCASCEEWIHQGTTSPRSVIAEHLKETHGFVGQVCYQDDLVDEEVREFVNMPCGLLEDVLSVLGAGADDEVHFYAPPRSRPDAPAPPPPQTDDEWRAIASMSMEDAMRAGLGNWDGDIALLPGEWSDSVPAWLQVESILGEVKKWSEVQDGDTRFGMLSVGVRLGPSNSEED